jgi:hypothetical protein
MQARFHRGKAEPQAVGDLPAAVPVHAPQDTHAPLVFRQRRDSGRGTLGLQPLEHALCHARRSGSTCASTTCASTRCVLRRSSGDAAR